MSRIKVLVVDDSAVVRQVVAALLGRDPGIEVIAAVADPILAIARMNVQWPDVIVLDIEMPRMDGITFLKKIMAERPTPVVICSTLAEKGAETSMAALAAGAVAIITKPKLGLKQFLEDASDDLGKPCITQHHLCLLHPFFHLVNFPSLRAQVFARRQAFEAFFGTCNRFLGALMQSGPTALATTSAAPSTNCPAQTRCATAARSSSDPGSAL